MDLIKILLSLFYFQNIQSIINAFFFLLISLLFLEQIFSLFLIHSLIIGMSFFSLYIDCLHLFDDLFLIAFLSNRITQYETIGKEIVIHLIVLLMFFSTKDFIRAINTVLGLH